MSSRALSGDSTLGTQFKQTQNEVVKKIQVKLNDN